MATLTLSPTGYRVDLRQPVIASPLPAEVRSELIERLRAGAAVVVEHVERHKLIYRIGAVVLTVLIGVEVEAFAAAAGSGLDAGAEKLYRRLVGVGKWIIIIKGAFDTISSTVQGDFVAARKSGIAYMLVYLILLGLPWAFNQIEIIFEDVT